MNATRDLSNFFKSVGALSQSATKAVTDAGVSLVESAKNAVSETMSKINTVNSKPNATDETAQKEHSNVTEPAYYDTSTKAFIRALGDSPIALAPGKINQIKETFPIPREQEIVWADAEFDLRPSGIALTNKGVFIRSNVQLLRGRPVLLFYDWSDFEPSWFISESESENKALLVDPACSKIFIEACRKQTEKGSSDESAPASPVDIDPELDKRVVKASVAAGAAVESSQSAVFVEQKARVNTASGHGEMAEEANTLLDKLHGLNAKVVGRDNAKDGADRQIGDMFIQTKYYNSARGSLESCFNPETGQYRYIDGNGNPMQLEVPKDQYERVLEGFKRKIERGKVPGVTDPNEAVNIVRRGRLTYRQAVNLTKPGTIESLSYDALTGLVTCSCALGITFVVTVFQTFRKTGDITQSVQAGISSGLQMFGISFVQHMAVSQIARTGLAKSLLAPSQYVISKLGYHTSATIVNGIRALSGKSAIHGAAASQHLARLLRSNVLTSALSMAVFSIPETYNVASRKISGAQYAKNMSVLAGSVAGGTGGAVAAGIAAAKIAGMAGTAVSPGIGTAIGIVGGFVGGTVGAAVAKTAGDLLHEDDSETFGRLFNAYVSLMIGEYLLDEGEIDGLIARLNGIKQAEFKNLFAKLNKSDEQECLIRSFLDPYFEAVVSERTHFALPSPDCVASALVELAAP